MRRTLAAAAAAAVLVSCGAPAAAVPPPSPSPGATPAGDAATGNGDWSVAPATTSRTLTPRRYFSMDAAPGVTVPDAVRITNYTARAIRFHVYGADAYNVPRDGGFALRTSGEPQRDAGSWIRLKATEVVLPPHAWTVVPFTVAIPANATPGEHIGGVVALNEAVEGVQATGGTRIGLRRAVGARLYLTVAGPLVQGVRPEGLTVRRSAPIFGTGSAVVGFAVVNTGNLRLTPTVRVRVTGAFGRTVRRFPARTLPELLPGQRVDLSVPWRGVPAVDAMTVRVEVAAGTGPAVRAQSQFVQVPWPALLILLAAAVFLWALRPLLVRRLRGPLDEDLDDDPAEALR